MLSSKHSFDAVFIIHMESRVDLYEFSCRSLEKWLSTHQLGPIRYIPAVDTSNFLEEEPLFINSLLTHRILSSASSGFRNDKQEFLHEIGCLLSHMKCWKIAHEESLHNVLILEEGAAILENSWNIFILLMNIQLPPLISPG